MKQIDEIYKDWCGESHLINSGHPVHDSAEACDFAEYYHNVMKEFENDTYGKIMTIGAGDFEQKIHIETIKQLVRDQKNVVFITGHNLPPADILVDIVKGAREKHPELFDSEKLYEKPMKIHQYRAPAEIPEIVYQKDNDKKGHQRPYKFHR
jgi:hypothetical protein